MEKNRERVWPRGLHGPARNEVWRMCVCGRSIIGYDDRCLSGRPAGLILRIVMR